MASPCRCDVCTLETSSTTGYCEKCINVCVREGSVDGRAQFFRLSRQARLEAHLAWAREGKADPLPHKIQTGHAVADEVVNAAMPMAKKAAKVMLDHWVNKWLK